VLEDGLGGNRSGECEGKVQSVLEQGQRKMGSGRVSKRVEGQRLVGVVGERRVLSVGGG
jgi:hypothetical protein